MTSPWCLKWANSILDCLAEAVGKEIHVPLFPDCHEPDKQGIGRLKWCLHIVIGWQASAPLQIPFPQIVSHSSNASATYRVILTCIEIERSAPSRLSTHSLCYYFWNRWRGRLGHIYSSSLSSEAETRAWNPKPKASVPRSNLCLYAGGEPFSQDAHTGMGRIIQLTSFNL